MAKVSPERAVTSVGLSICNVPSGLMKVASVASSSATTSENPMPSWAAIPFACASVVPCSSTSPNVWKAYTPLTRRVVNGIPTTAPPAWFGPLRESSVRETGAPLLSFWITSAVGVGSTSASYPGESGWTAAQDLPRVLLVIDE